MGRSYKNPSVPLPESAFVYAEAIAGWRKLAREALEHAVYLEGRGEYAGAYRNKADTYERTAKSLELELETGEEHCVCCLKPSRSCGYRRAQR